MANDGCEKIRGQEKPKLSGQTVVWQSQGLGRKRTLREGQAGPL